ncbi:transcriptional regulator with XRE-family HTH domain [Pseudoxanthomonas japonensis]|uniref:helix-turn-helix domain-containing protein n=1 Tax=Pseudoxanthomonas japonensis TaxID=69284 RepID=UPI002865490F|nr:helix-turn-helix transcriptional regulator [Pseudoxanthomonas japonensis]MDR7068131.1 transcriptional regulator with XRE-family HTH domain [Pseudoxanthomonas japonensis]
MSAAPLTPRSVVAARLRQARQLRSLSQRQVGVRMGLDKETASARISRYESETMAISLESLFELARALDVPAAYLLATTPAMADAILSLGRESETQQESLAAVLAALTKLPASQRKLLMKDFVEGILSKET